MIFSENKILTFFKIYDIIILESEGSPYGIYTLWYIWNGNSACGTSDGSHLLPLSFDTGHPRVGRRPKVMKTKMDKRINKKSPEELSEYLMFRRRGHVVPAKKGRGSPYKRNSKHRRREEET